LVFKAVRGFKDILSPESYIWQRIERVARSNLELFGFSEIRTPILERSELFQRSIGENTDIVEKEMYTFLDRNGESLTLRPEATAGIIRAFIEGQLYKKRPIHRLYTIGPMFRYERPQKGRLRQFHQINAELVGTDDPIADTEVIWVAWKILKDLGAEEMRLEVNSLGCPKCRPEHRKDLVFFLENNKDKLCPDCRRRSTVNPLRVFDCKNASCKETLMFAPTIKHYWCPGCAEHLGKVLDNLEALEIPFVINPYLVRGLDYYQRTTFEIRAQGLGAQDTVAAGGRYDRLVEDLGGPPVPGVGMAIGIERLRLLLGDAPGEKGIDCYIAAIGKEAREYAMEWLKGLREGGLRAETAYGQKGLKAQMRQADRSGARFCIIVGERELEEEEAIIRNMGTHEQVTVPFDQVVPEVLAKIEKQEEEGRD